LCAAVLLAFLAVDAAALLSPDLGAPLLRNLPIIVAIGVAALVAIGALLLAGRRRSEDVTVGNDTLQHVLDAIGGFSAIHGVNTRHGRIEHVLVGQGGIFLVSADASRGRVVADERSVRVGTKALAQESYGRLGQQARYLESRIQQVCGRRIPVQAVYVFTRATMNRDGWRNGVRFVSLGSLPATLASSRAFIDPRDVAVVRALVTGDPTSLSHEARFGPDAQSALFPALGRAEEPRVRG